MFGQFHHLAHSASAAVSNGELVAVSAKFSASLLSSFFQFGCVAFVRLVRWLTEKPQIKGFILK